MAMRATPARLRGWLRPITRLGWTVALAGVLVWVAMWRTGWHELAIVVATCAVVVAAAVPFTLGGNRFGVTVEVHPRRLTAGERASGRIAVRNDTGRRSLPVLVELPVGAGSAAFRVPSLARGVEHDELFTIPTTRRAVIRVGPATTVRGDPLGLLRRERAWEEEAELYVHPRITLLDRLGSGFLRDLEGQATNHLSPSDVAFHTLREYVPGDDRRHVHWKTTARTGTLMVRQFVDTRRSFLALVVSTDPGDYASDDEFELAVSLAASLGVRALRDEQSVTLVAGGRHHDALGATQLLDTFSGVELQATRGGLDAGVVEANRVASDASIAVLVTGSMPTVAALRAAAKRLATDARVIALRTGSGGRGTFQTLGTTTVVNVPELDALARLLLAVSLS